jgi:hypothetical protein
MPRGSLKIFDAMTRKSLSGNHCLAFVLLVAASLSNNALAGSCDMQTQMQAAQSAEQQRRLNNITNSYQQLGLLNDLQNQCLAAMPAVPTEIGGSSLIATAMNRIMQSTCNQLASKARSTAQSAISQARYTAQSAVSGIIGNGAISNTVTGIAGNYAANSLSSGTDAAANAAATQAKDGLLSNVTNTSNAAISSALNSITRLFQ